MIDITGAVGISVVGSFAGRDPERSVEDNLPAFRCVWRPLIGRAEDLGESFASKDARAITALVEAGYEDRILLSHDVCWKVHLKHYGGFGYSFILERFLPYLLEAGVTPAQVRKFMVDNPARVLPFVAPRPL